jgi:hypothetical protein
MIRVRAYSQKIIKEAVANQPIGSLKKVLKSINGRVEKPENETWVEHQKEMERLFALKQAFMSKN